MRKVCAVKHIRDYGFAAFICCLPLASHPGRSCRTGRPDEQEVIGPRNSVAHPVRKVVQRVDFVLVQKSLCAMFVEYRLQFDGCMAVDVTVADKHF